MHLAPELRAVRAKIGSHLSNFATFFPRASVSEVLKIIGPVHVVAHAPPHSSPFTALQYSIRQSFFLAEDWRPRQDRPDNAKNSVDPKNPRVKVGPVRGTRGADEIDYPHPSQYQRLDQWLLIFSSRILRVNQGDRSCGRLL